MEYTEGVVANQIIELLQEQNELLKTLLAKSYPDLVEKPNKKIRFKLEGFE